MFDLTSCRKYSQSEIPLDRTKPLSQLVWNLCYRADRFYKNTEVFRHNDFCLKKNCTDPVNFPYKSLTDASSLLHVSHSKN